MKLIIDIDEDRYKDVIEAQKHHLLDSYAQAVANGIPLEQITAEIYEHFMTIDGQVHDTSAIKCMEIIGKYKGDKE